ncbi:MAG: hypothetical protein A3D24_00225 [Candidatus Blackburnbacteria bacterium RIFCSPHIGHO2_02_FULL_39_13]|uniref:Uncharacterized protein n=1 Tax=Candidatus Blackburnbacteria bacterium RIFCSPLOWO2_01_FULL_40_20 TaxID=1797519 RepID=A0A1G1VF08_9BACT|nr:MAG: RNA binding protein [Microgenomates group bacterium GW2011_GWA2_39_19]OGY07222.1 MAG: hypothetical protein A2694_02315 [Candidatus Blackburnbacteria bacterium RIFCSPHIGHO2_01_FULL_40_17]OGY09445.1 MAG: hypothetical protein A3D24_00225 [Candidatus Blackburnbacteria bacterium RIFCSPHIGHO2_02_FULL_39_13]OGY14023.1 MAG: hypothetical protein A3A77_03440 [Candidatus Blackburnbacteria bacterium RIFCSPLOWO2_01_FULL_40_20]OGY15715.1 MAG: hypothetical protein A3I52_01475 [Candidatus Blackburnbact
MISLLEYLIKEITGNEDISINEETSSDVQVYYIKAPSSVIGSIIGKNGRTIRAIRSICRARAIKDQVNIAIRVEESAS